MAYEAVDKPIPLREAFLATGSAAALSQAALFLLLRDQLITARRGSISATAAADEVRGRAGPDLADIRVPWLGQTVADLSLDELFRLAPPGSEFSVSSLAGHLFESSRLSDAAILLTASIRSDEAITRVTSAGTLIELVGPDPRLVQLVVAATHDDDALTREVAATLLAAVIPDHPRLLQMTAGEDHGGTERVRTSLLIHGTWARRYTWWRSGGDFHSFVQTNVWPDVYSGSDAFAWPGGYSDEARELASQDLIDWVASHGPSAPRLMAHSHGGSVSMLATQHSVSVPHLVLLSCPVHTRYLPEFHHVQKTTSIRVHLDLVILADRGGQRFRDSRIDEHVLPLWFHHSCTHDPAVWVRHNVTSWL
jgi:hypothetical protein